MSQPVTTVLPRSAARTLAPHELPRLHVVTDTRGGRDPLPDVAAALAAARSAQAGLVVQVRAKEACDRDLFDLTARVLALRDVQFSFHFGEKPADGHGRRPEPRVLVLVDDRVDVAVLAGADGAHLGALDLPLAEVRRGLGAGVVLGGTAREPDTAARLSGGGATYLGVGPCFATTTKSGLPDPLGPPGLTAVTQRTTLPVIAIGGVTTNRVPELLRAGAHGVAVVSAVSSASDPGAATTALLRAIEASA
jgi:thiamine-phosphate pyrophosphorylase